MAVGDIPVETTLNSVRVAVSQYLEQRDNSRDRRPEQLRITLNVIKEITTLHLHAINEVTKPLASQNDILTTYHLFHLLVNNADIPNGYAETKGFLKGAIMWPESLKDETKYHGLKKILCGVRNFQYTAFTISCNEAFRDVAHPGKTAILSSFSINNHFRRANVLYNMLKDSCTNDNKDKIPGLKQEILSNFSTAFCYLQLEPEMKTPKTSRTMDSLDDFTSLNRQWFSAWQQSLQMGLFGRDGIYAAIGEFEACMRKF